jgi:hypothetical protein
MPIRMPKRAGIVREPIRDRGPLTIVIPSPPRTKKNSSRIVGTRRGNPRLLPSEAFAAWNAVAQMELAQVRMKETGLPFRGPVNLRALFFRHADVGDAVGFYQSLADALQEGRIVENDRQVRQWDGSRLLKDAVNPRIILTVEPL